jgi:hypothetical protein
LKTIVFTANAAGLNVPGEHVDLSDNEESRVLDCVIDKHGKRWFEEFASWLGELNQRNASLLWWAHTSTAKNLLSSPLGERFIHVQAVCEIARRTQAATLHVFGATPGQMDAIARILPRKEFRFAGADWHKRFWHRAVSSIEGFARLFVQSARVIAGFWPHKHAEFDRSAALCLFTYLDGAHRAGIDRYFGELPRILSGRGRATSCIYLAYVYAPYRPRLRELQAEQGAVPYIALFGLLRMADHLWALSNALRQWWRKSWSFTFNYGGQIEYEPLLREAQIHDLAVGEYLHHLLVYRATRRFFRHCAPQAFIYPFENKSIEKMVLLGIADSGREPKVVGYQHTSITARHAGLLFSRGEAQLTPLPQRIITVGKVTKDYLEAAGNYPWGILAAGCALRQMWRSGQEQQRTGRASMRVLLALSSSRRELVRSVAFFKKVMALVPGLELGIRPHINFPIALLPQDLAIWMHGNARDLSGTTLQENLDWCGVTAYVSSTVALETLMCGKPVINIRIGEVVSPDPVLGEVPFRWTVETAEEMSTVLAQIREMSDSEYASRSARAVDYVRNYLSPLDDAALSGFG